MSQTTKECNPELVSAFLDGELDQIILGHVTRHLMNCEECCRTMSRLVQVRDAVADQFTLCEPERLTQSVMMAIRNEKSISPRKRIWDKLGRFGILALFLAVLVAPLPAMLEADDHVEDQKISC